MKRYRLKKREVWDIFYEVNAADEESAQNIYAESDEVKREFFSVDLCEAFNTIEEIQK
jgi:hypothetical protein